MEGTMEGIVFVPGITGSQLNYHSGGSIQQIWPPQPWDMAGYQEISELMDRKHVTVGNVIDTIILPCVDIYDTTETDLRTISDLVNGATPGPYLPAPYDWRLDIFQGADQIEKQIEQWLTSSALTEITIVCHSLGGLAVRLLVEWKYATTPPNKRPKWFNLVKRILFICTPHLGAPTALAKILGLEDAETIRASDVRKFSADSHFPSGYQLLPSASRNILYDTEKSKYLRYDNSAVSTALGLSKPNLLAVQKLSAALDPAKKPANVEYMFVYGTGQPTDEGVEIAGLTLNGALPWQDDQTGVPSGDGTVPSWSIVEAATDFSPNIPLWSGPGDHLGILTTNAFRQELYKYFGLPEMASRLAKDNTGIVVSLNKRCYREGEIMSVLLIPDFETELLSGSLFLSRLNGEGTKVISIGQQKEVTARGGSTRSFSVKLAAPAVSGGYRFDFGGNNATHSTTERTAGWFSVVPKEQPTIRGIAPRTKRARLDDSST
jgi:phospholipase A1